MRFNAKGPAIKSLFFSFNIISALFLLLPYPHLSQLPTLKLVPFLWLKCRSGKVEGGVKVRREVRNRCGEPNFLFPVFNLHTGPSTYTFLSQSLITVGTGDRKAVGEDQWCGVRRQ